MEESRQKEILREIEAGYDKMANKFSETRKFFWKGLEFIGNFTEDGDRVLDFGCGNGRLAEIFSGKDIEYLGVDVSQKLIDMAAEKYGKEKFSFKKISGFGNLLLEDETFDAVYSIAVFHHIPSRDLREKIARNIFRVVKSGGYAVITVWNLWQKKYIKYIIRNWLDKFSGGSDLEKNDCYVPFRDNKGNYFNRFHHAFRKKELENLFEGVGFQKIFSGIVDNRNIVFIGKK